MAESHFDGTFETGSSGANVAKQVMVAEACGACKYLKRKCSDECILAPYFGADHGADKFAVVHKVFGASNVKKLLSNIPPNNRHEAVRTISYEAEARLSDPIYGCVSTIMALQQQVATMQAEITTLKSHLANFTQQHQQQQPNVNVEVQPVYSNNLPGYTTNLMNMSNFNPSTTNFMNVGNFNHGFDLPMEPPQHF